MRIALVIITKGRTHATDHLVQSLRENTRLPHDIHVVDHSVTPDGLSARTGLWIPDRHGKGQIWVKSAALNLIRTGTHYDYVWFMSDEAAMRTDTDPVGTLVDILERNPKMAILAPSDPTGDYPGSTPVAKQEWHAATNCPHIGFMMRTQAIDEVGFMNPRLRYSLGAMMELSYKLYQSGWFVAYADSVRTHQPVVLEPAPGQDPATLERVSERFAFDYLFSNYGWEWSTHFFDATSAHQIAENGYAFFHQRWAKAFQAEELEIRKAAVTDEAPLLSADANKTPIAEPPEFIEPVVEIQSDAPMKLLVWPKYDSAADLEAMVGEYGRFLLNRKEIALCVRHDPDRDIDINAACTAMALAHERILGQEVDLHILLVNNEIPAEHWGALGKAIDGCLLLPSSSTDPERAAFHDALDVKIYESVHALKNEVDPAPRIPSLEDLFPGMEQLAG